jgi:hypothetical protein
MDWPKGMHSGHLAQMVLEKRYARDVSSLRSSVATILWGDLLALHCAETVDEVPAVVRGLSNDGEAYEATISGDCQVSLRIYVTCDSRGVVSIADARVESRRIRDWIEDCTEWGAAPLALLCHVDPYAEIELEADRLCFGRPQVRRVSGLKGVDWLESLESHLDIGVKGKAPLKKVPDKAGPAVRTRIEVASGVDLFELFLEVETAK